MKQIITASLCIQQNSDSTTAYHQVECEKAFINDQFQFIDFLNDSVHLVRLLMIDLFAADTTCRS